MTNDNLAPVFLDNKPVSLKDPKPKLSAILSASGRPETTDVKWLQFQPNTPGKSLRSEEVLDRTTDPSKPIYLTSAPKTAVVPPIANAPHGKTEGKSGGEGMIGSTAPAFGTAKGNTPAGGKTTEIKHASTQDDDSGMQDDSADGGEDET